MIDQRLNQFLDHEIQNCINAMLKQDINDMPQFAALRGRHAGLQSVKDYLKKTAKTDLGDLD